ncbi:serine hydrolase domain-containing protein [Streptomyces sp. NBC_00344]|uniref:serine hydrolase domain-containing protein n=1 Tax=Streptomyces sp. NBC_00344 TaxID=2975720 RepID=UPI002E227BB6
MPKLRLLLAAPLALALLGATTASLPGEPRVKPVPGALTRLVSDGGAPGAALLGQNATGARFRSAGHGLHRRDRFRVGSITKTFVATVVLQLVAEHRLALSDTVADHLPRLIRGDGNDGRRITLRALLSHTSGLYNYTADAGPPPHSALSAVRVALSHPPVRRGRFAYSNTDYSVLGLIIRQTTGHSYAAEARRRIIAPLRLGGTSFPGAATALPEPHGPGYSSGRDVTAFDPRVAGAAGELISTLADLNRFYRALLGGRLLPAVQRRELLDTRGTGGAYGLGIYPERMPCGVVVWGHNGRIAGSYVRAATTAHGGRTVTFRVNTDDPMATGLERDVLNSAFCR